MIRKLLQLMFLTLVSFATGCVKDTYDMDKLSGQVHLSPTLALHAINGDVSFSDMVESNDTLVYDENNFVKIMFREDSILDLKMVDFYDLNDMVSFSEGYTVGALAIDPFYKTIELSLNEISLEFPAALRAQFVALDNTTNNFPSFSATDMGETAFSLITTFENAVFSSGTIEISIQNNLTAPLSGINIQLYNSLGHIPIGNEVIIPSIIPGELGIASVDLADEYLTNSIFAAIVITGSPGTSTPVYIDLNGSAVEVGIRGRDLEVKSGRVILPTQTIGSLDDKDTITFDPGTDIEIDEFLITEGTLSYQIQSTSPVKATMEITLSTALRSGVPITELISVDPNTTLNGTILADNTIIDLGTDPSIPYNRVPMEYSIEISSDNLMVDFDWEDEITLDIELLNPEFDYVKGYFGQQTESIDPDSLMLEIEDVLSNISGDFLISSPSITLNYSNSFAIPMEIDLEGTGRKEEETVDLGLAPFIITYPVTLENRDVTATFAIDKTNSSLPELISLPPSQINFSGTAKMNPAGNNGLRDNYIFGNSRFLGSLEIEVPMEFRMNNLQYSDTLDNFLDEAFDDEGEINWDDFELFRVDFNVVNGFPMGVSLNMILHDSINQMDLASIDATDILEPAPVDSNGKASGVAETATSIEFTEEFFSSINLADKIIFTFTLNTTDNGTTDVKIYSDYRIDFNAALVMKADINLK